MTATVLLIINSGSSSVKFQVFSYTTQLAELARGQIANLGTAPKFTASNNAHPEQKLIQNLSADFNHTQSIQSILDWIRQQQNWNISAVVHRVVHGGTEFQNSVRITPDIVRQLKKLNSLAPLHQPHNLKGIEIIEQINPDLPQIACFDTAFHSQHTPLFSTYALPESLRKQGIRRYGFHGLSFEWIAHTLKEEHPDLARGKIIIAHLGNGASLCALENGISIDTTMGLTALDGLPMGTRCGSQDPGAIIYMIRDLGIPPADLEQMLYNNSGLLGLSGLTNNVQILQESQDEKAQFALDYFCLKTAQYMGMMAVALNGVDGIVFTGGIGEHSEQIRTHILTRLEFLRPFSVLVIPANEEKMMVAHALSLLRNLD
ncbi:acetate/propionate family kinase [uncultured Legionella sp.]|uniref:acetate/propionate family kinase n=1 Tax=uncultured Legionella sp. TaxID=210934 RepID=UPI00262F8E40|nr:acetate/propionate family kinase [uncultured Legionella sp.]